MLSGNKKDPSQWAELAALAVVPNGAGWSIDESFLPRGVLCFDAAATDVEERRATIARVPDVLLEVRSATVAWTDLLRSGGDNS